MYLKHQNEIVYISPFDGTAHNVDADVVTFEAFNASWGRDKNHVFNGAAITTAKPRNVHLRDGVVHGVGEVLNERFVHLDVALDVSSLVELGGPYYSDSRAVYCFFYGWDDFDLFEVENADRNTFEHVGGHFGRDKTHVFYLSNLEKRLQPQSISNLNDRFVKDDETVLFIPQGDKHSDVVGLQLVEHANGGTFKVVGPNLARDRDNVFYFYSCGGLAARRHLTDYCIRIDTPRPAEFVILESHEGDLPDGYDGEHLFFRGHKLEIPPNSFRVSGDHLVWCDRDEVQSDIESRPENFSNSVDPVDRVSGVSVEPRSRIVTSSDDEDIPF